MHFNGKVSNGKQDYLFKIPLILGSFLVECQENNCSLNIPTGISDISWLMESALGHVVEIDVWLFLITSYADTKQT